MTDHEHDGAGQAPDGKIETDQREATSEDMLNEMARRILQHGSSVLVDGVPHILVPRDAGNPPGLRDSEWPQIHDPELRLAPLYAALAQAQAAFPEITKNRTATIRPQSGNSFEFKYSDLSDLINATRPALTSNGIAVFQIPDDKRENCITTLAHSTGLTLVGSYPIKHKDGGRMHPGQDWAISWAFARRYGMSAMLGIAAEETVEGDQSGNTDPNFGAASGDGKLGVRGVVIPEGLTKAEEAKLYGAGIETLMNAASTATGLDGVWKRNVEMINALQDHFPNVYQDIVAVYEQCKAAFGEE
jgi:hypothetical protein